MPCRRYAEADDRVKSRCDDGVAGLVFLGCFVGRESRCSIEDEVEELEGEL